MAATEVRDEGGAATAGWCRTTAADFRVHLRVYTDPALFEAELERLFHRGWVYVGHTSEVAQPGSFKTTRLGRRPILLSRDEGGALHVLLNVCRHRGATVCREAAGQAASFQCPYHGWVYGLDGELRGISERAGYPADFGADLDGLVRVPRVAEYRGLIFASLSAAGESLEAWLGGARAYVDLWADLSPTGRVAVRPAHRYGYAGNWKFQVENTVDGYHPRFVHESAFRTREHFGGRPARDMASSLDQGYTIGFDDRGHSVLEWPEGTDNSVTKMPRELADDWVGKLRARLGPERTRRVLTRRHVVIMPNLVLMDVNIRVIQPLAVDRTEVLLALHGGGGRPGRREPVAPAGRAGAAGDDGDDQHRRRGDVRGLPERATDPGAGVGALRAGAGARGTAGRRRLARIVHGRDAPARPLPRLGAADGRGRTLTAGRLAEE